MEQSFCPKFPFLIITTLMLMLQDVEIVTATPVPVDTSQYWGDWSNWTSCSRHCGGGVSKRKRNCLVSNDDLRNELCKGQSSQYRSCNTQRCTSKEDEGDFRELQCSLFNEVPHNGTRYDWLPYTPPHGQNSTNLCALNCYPDGENFYVTFAQSVEDGTPCSDDKRNPGVCVDGMCWATSCDGVIGSNVTYDKCGVCGGNGSSCVSVTRTFERSITSAYFMVVKIPAASKNIQIHHSHSSHSHLAIRDINCTHYLNCTYYLNGNYTIEPPGLYHIAGTVFNYTKESKGLHGWRDSLYALGPTIQPLIITAMAWGDQALHKFKYSYQKPKEDADVVEPTLPTEYADHDWQYRFEGTGSVYIHEIPDKNLENFEPPKPTQAVPPCSPNCVTSPEWKLDSWSSCSKTCGGGKKTAGYVCQQESFVLDDSECRTVKPQDEAKDCRTYDCPASWEIGGWSNCTEKCGGGKRTRKVGCWRLLANGPKERVLPKFCSTVLPPKSRERCNTEKCWGKWQKEKWGQCDNRCGNGFKHRQVYCTKDGNKTSNSNCNPELKPAKTESCYNHHACENEWFAGNWGSCSVTCGHGIQTREVVCYGSNKGDLDQRKALPDDRCNLTKKTEMSTRPCTIKQLCPPDWVTGNWSACSKTCGNGGHQKTTVLCMQNGTETPGQCAHRIRPFDFRNCRNNPPCPPLVPVPKGCKDRTPNYCTLLRSSRFQTYNLCQYRKQKRDCCQTCHELTKG